MRAALRLVALFVPALAWGVDVPRIPAVKANLNAPVVKTPAVDLLPAGLPSAVPAIPALPGSLLPLEVDQASLEAAQPGRHSATIGDRVREQAAEGSPDAIRVLELLERAAVQDQEKPGAGDAARPHFDGGKAGGDDGGSGSWTPAVPQGVVRVQVRTIRTAADVAQAIPWGSNSNQLREDLQQSVRRMAPYRVFTYVDSKGKTFTAIDLSQKPRLVEVLPEQQSHEVQLIKKIQLYNKDLQVMVREDGKTPDLVMGGVMTELKSLIRADSTLEDLVNHANTQVYEHAQRHVLGDGAVAVDLTREARVPVQQVINELNRWSARAEGEVVTVKKSGERFKKQPNALQTVYAFSQTDMRVFHRQDDGTYSLSKQSAKPSMKLVPAKTIVARDSHTAQLLVKNGRRRAAGKLVAQARVVEKVQGADRQHSPVAQAKERIEALKFLEQAKKLARRRRFASLSTLWANFKDVRSPGAVHEIQEAMNALLGDETEGERVAREIDAPRAALAAAGFKSAVTVYGSARVRPGSRWYAEARKFAQLVGRHAGRSLAVVTGGGPGIMEAANRGAYESGGLSVGHNIVLPREQKPNRWQTPGLSFNYQSFAARKANLRHQAAAHVYFPGGFGTMDELFELLTLIQTGKTPPAPIVLVGEKDYWREVLDFKAFERLGLISKGDLDLFTFVQNADEAWFAVSETLGD